MPVVSLQQRMFIIFVCFLSFFLVKARAQANDHFVFAIHPYLPATELVKRFNPLVGFLSEKLDTPITIKVQKSYAAQIDRVGRDQADIAYMGPAEYVKMTAIYGKKPLLACLEVKGCPVFFGMIIVPKNSSIRSLKALKGKSFAFGDPNSTMSHLVPRFVLHQAGVQLADLGSHEFLGSHHNVALGVLGGYYDAGGVKEEVFYQYQGRGLRMLAKSPPIPEHVFVTRSTFPGKKIELLRKTLLSLNKDEQGMKLLTSIKKTVTGMAAVTDKDYDGLRTILKKVSPSKSTR